MSKSLSRKCISAFLNESKHFIKSLSLAISIDQIFRIFNFICRSSFVFQAREFDRISCGQELHRIKGDAVAAAGEIKSRRPKRSVESKLYSHKRTTVTQMRLEFNVTDL